MHNDSPPQETQEEIQSVSVPSPISGRPCNASLSILGDMLALFNTGCLLKVTGNQVLAPFDGVITDIEANQLSVKLKATNGLRIWVKVSEVMLAAHTAGCFAQVKVNDQVKKNDVLLQFNPTILKQFGALPYARVIITNSQNIKRTEITKARQCLALEDNLFTLGF